MTFDELKSKWSWSPIRDCPGRFVWREDAPPVAPEELVGDEVPLREFCSAKAADTVVVGRFGDGGLISYRKPNGTYRHTLNTVEGFARKLAQLEIEL